MVLWMRNDWKDRVALLTSYQSLDFTKAEANFSYKWVVDSKVEQKIIIKACNLISKKNKEAFTLNNWFCFLI